VSMVLCHECVCCAQRRRHDAKWDRAVGFHESLFCVSHKKVGNYESRFDVGDGCHENVRELTDALGFVVSKEGLEHDRRFLGNHERTGRVRFLLVEKRHGGTSQMID
jgi:hypothetical protein